MSTFSDNQHPGPADRTGALPATAPARDSDRAARVALTWLTEPGDHTVWSLVEQHGAPATLDLVVRGDVPDIVLTNARRATAADRDAQRIAVEALHHAQQLGTRIVTPADDEWPVRLNALAGLAPDALGPAHVHVRPPLCLWVRGAWPLREAFDRSVAVVGARAATHYGTTVAAGIASEMAARGWTIVAGGAYGIETAAHHATMAAGGRTVAVLPCGVDRPYPAGNAAMFARIADDGLLISEWPFGTEPLRHRFLARNWLIAAATRGTVVVEAAVRSGSAQMMQSVLALGRAAMVVPGPVTSALSAGSHELLRAHPQAKLVTGVPHILEALLPHTPASAHHTHPASDGLT
ncbi:DNA processing protein [Catenuloplanes nepalensis]|uniref:DNA processing protein n=1 Tax=Catenuloplanes nepalensis TaxID=587533 RepID=A0ABT9MMS8_9ACTN|nr:DNA-processing protein DprA [Catenuloplanes nepalensis]MDP9792603.1 DNA processing protein [Catenuloplanes nepalensis]